MRDSETVDSECKDKAMDPTPYPGPRKQLRLYSERSYGVGYIRNFSVDKIVPQIVQDRTVPSWLGVRSHFCCRKKFLK